MVVVVLVVGDGCTFNPIKDSVADFLRTNGIWYIVAVLIFRGTDMFDDQGSDVASSTIGSKGRQFLWKRFKFVVDHVKQTAKTKTKKMENQKINKSSQEVLFNNNNTTRWKEWVVTYAEPVFKPEPSSNRSMTNNQPLSWANTPLCNSCCICL